MTNRIKLIRADTPENKEKYRRAKKYIELLSKGTPIKQVLEQIEKENAAATVVVKPSTPVVVNPVECEDELLRMLYDDEDVMNIYATPDQETTLDQFETCIQFITQAYKKMDATEQADFVALAPSLFDASGSFLTEVVVNHARTNFGTDAITTNAYYIKSQTVKGETFPVHLSFVRLVAHFYILFSKVSGSQLMGKKTYASAAKFVSEAKTAKEILAVFDETATTTTSVVDDFKTEAELNAMAWRELSRLATTKYKIKRATVQLYDDKKRDGLVQLILKEQEKVRAERDDEERLEKERLEKAEKKRLAKEEQRAEKERKAKEQAEKERVAKEEAEKQAKRDAETSDAEDIKPEKVVPTKPDDKTDESSVKEDEDDEKTTDLGSFEIPWNTATVDDATKYDSNQLMNATNWDKITTLGDDRKDVVIAFAKQLGVKGLNSRYKLPTIQNKVREFLEKSNGKKFAQVEPVVPDKFFNDDGEPNDAYLNMTEADMKEVIRTDSLGAIFMTNWQEELPVPALRTLAYHYEYEKNAATFNFIPADRLDLLNDDDDAKRNEYVDYLQVYFTLHKELKTGAEIPEPKDTMNLTQSDPDFMEVLTLLGSYPTLKFRLMSLTPKWQERILSSKDAIGAIEKHESTEKWMTLAKGLGYTGPNYYDEDDEKDVKKAVKAYVMSKVTFKKDDTTASGAVDALKKKAKEAMTTSFWENDTQSFVRSVTIDAITAASEESIRKGLTAKILSFMNKDQLIAVAEKLAIAGIDNNSKKDAIIKAIQNAENIKTQLLSMSEIQSHLENIERSHEYHSDKNVLDMDFISEQLYIPLQAQLANENKLETVKLHMNLEQPLLSIDGYHGIDMSDYGNQVRYFHTLSIIAGMINKGTIDADLVERCFVEWPPKVQAKKGQVMEV